MYAPFILGPQIAICDTDDHSLARFTAATAGVSLQGAMAMASLHANSSLFVVLHGDHSVDAAVVWGSAGVGPGRRIEVAKDCRYAGVGPRLRERTPGPGDRAAREQPRLVYCSGSSSSSPCSSIRTSSAAAEEQPSSPARPRRGARRAGSPAVSTRRPRAATSRPTNDGSRGEEEGSSAHHQLRLGLSQSNRLTGKNIETRLI
eukprot:COSAG06_NODE_61_length_27084_cov_48.281490_27_plen_203_part_00